jgi:RimJ/RimL family protein N-acetyltransferase
VGHWTLRGYGYWAVEEKETQAFVGCVGLSFPEGWPELELGYWLIPEAYGKGYATEAGLKARNYAFDDLGTKSLVSYIDPANEASKRVAERLGAKYDDTIDLLEHGPHCVYRYAEAN